MGKLPFTKNQWNDVEKATRKVLASSPIGKTAGVHSEQSIHDPIEVRNVSSTDLNFRDLVVLKQSTFSSVSNTEEYLRGPVSDADIFNDEEGGDGTELMGHGMNFAFVMEPIKMGSLGRAVAQGDVVLRINVDDVDDEYADLESGSQTPKSGSSGPIMFLEKPEATGDQLVRCRFPISQGGPRVKIVNNTGESIPEGAPMIVDAMSLDEGVFEVVKPYLKKVAPLLVLTGKALETGKTRSIPDAPTVKCRMKAGERTLIYGETIGPESFTWEWTVNGFTHKVKGFETDEDGQLWAYAVEVDSFVVVHGLYDSVAGSVNVAKVQSDGTTIGDYINIKALT